MEVLLGMQDFRSVQRTDSTAVVVIYSVPVRIRPS